MVVLCFYSSHFISYSRYIPFTNTRVVRSCNTTYYGKTVRHLKTRACEHAGISDRTGKPVKTPKASAILDHLSSCDNPVLPKMSDFTVLASADCDFHLLIKESLLIARDRPRLNTNVSSLPLLLF